MRAPAISGSILPLCMLKLAYDDVEHETGSMGGVLVGGYSLVSRRGATNHGIRAP